MSLRLSTAFVLRCTPSHEQSIEKGNEAGPATQSQRNRSTDSIFVGDGCKPSAHLPGACKIVRPVADHQSFSPRYALCDHRCTQVCRLRTWTSERAIEESHQASSTQQFGQVALGR